MKDIFVSKPEANFISDKSNENIILINKEKTNEFLKKF